MKNKPCPHTILAFIGNNKGVYCIVCKIRWVRKRVAYGSEFSKSVLEIEEVKKLEFPLVK